MVHSLCNLPTNTSRDFYVYLLDYGWEEGLSREMYKNFPRMAEAASRHGAVVLQGTVGHHFADEVLSWHHVNGHDAKDLLPAILVTNKHPHEFRENSWNSTELRDRLLLIPLRKICKSPDDVAPLIEELFSDIQKNQRLSKFKISERMFAGQDGATLDALVLDPRPAQTKLNIKQIMAFLTGQSVATHRSAQSAESSTNRSRGKHMTIDHKKVFVIHGRNIAAKNAIEQFLRALNLEPIDFDELAADLGASFVGDIVRAGLKRAQGIIALFTADEAAFLRPEHHQSHDSSEDQCRWQSRQNVIFEAGMAYGMAPKRTILVVLGSETKLFSDVKGIHLSFLNNSPDSRKRLRQKLIGAKCQVDLRNDAWLDPSRSGDFDSCVLPALSLSVPFDIKTSSSSLSETAASASLSSVKPTPKIIKHDKTVFAAADGILPEQALRDFLSQVSCDHSYTDIGSSPINKFINHFDLESNSYLIEELKVATNNFTTALKKLSLFLSTHFFVYPNIQPLKHQSGFQYCMYPEANVDRAGDGSEKQMKRYEKYSNMLHELTEQTEQSYIEYRKTIKRVLVM